jgi:hypothetical protein
MKRVVILQMVAASVYVLFMSSALAMPQAPPGPYESIEDEFHSTGYRGNNPVPAPDPRLNVQQFDTQHSRRNHNRGPYYGTYPSEQDQPLMPWPKPYTQQPYQEGGYRGYPQGLSR